MNSPSYTLGYLGNPIYGRDLTGDNSPQLLINPQQTYMPVYGMKVEDTAFLAIIEQGEALARINANKAGFANSFHSVFPRFNVMPMTNLSLGPIGDVNVYQKRIYQGDIQVRYYFLTGADADYVGMAKAYQEYLVEKYELKPIDGEEPLPFYLSIVGNIVRNEPVVGIPRERSVRLQHLSRQKRLWPSYLRACRNRSGTADGAGWTRHLSQQRSV